MDGQGETDGLDVLVEDQWPCQLQQGHVKVQDAWVVLGMQEDPPQPQLHGAPADTHQGHGAQVRLHLLCRLGAVETEPQARLPAPQPTPAPQGMSEEGDPMESAPLGLGFRSL